MAKLTVNELQQLSNGTEVLWTFQSGSRVVQHRAIVKKRINKSLLLHVFFSKGNPEVRRWSLVTNQPLFEYRGHIGGAVWLQNV